MKKFLKIFVPIFLSLSIVFGIGWYLFFYDTELTEDIFLSCAEYFERKDNTKIANWFYNRAMENSKDPDTIVIDMANRYLKKGDYTAAEVTLNNAIANGGKSSVYVALSNVYIKQNKLLDALNLLDNITDPILKQELDNMRPAPPTANYQDGEYNSYISLSFESQGNMVYVTANGKYPSTDTDLHTTPIVTTEGVNLFQTVSVAPNGLVSPIKEYKFTIGGVIEKVIFKDSAIESKVREMLNLPQNYEIMSNDVWKIKSFTIPANALDYSDLKLMKSLETLEISEGISNQLTNLSSNSTLKTLIIQKTMLSFEDLEAIGKLTSLKSLTMESCMISTISPLASLTALEVLNINTNSVRDIEALRSLKELKELNMHRNALEDISAISDCVRLEVLDISDNPFVTSIAPLTTCTMLQNVNISHCSIKEISVLSNAMDLLQLNASNNQITTIEGLENCLRLTNLNLSVNSIADLTPLINHSELVMLDFSNNQITQLPSWIPSCKLVTINGNHNLISDLSPLAGLENLNNILMNGNTEISKLEMLLSCPLLIEVQVYDTKVSKEEAEKLSLVEEGHQTIVVIYQFAEPTAP